MRAGIMGRAVAAQGNGDKGHSAGVMVLERRAGAELGRGE